ncbi:MAG: TetR/AcrR family transcriptional regulator [Pseudomonadota bacterium]
MAKEDRAAKIVDGAFGILMAEGLPHLSYKAVAEASGMTRQLVRYYFPQNDDLMIALCDKLAAIYRETLIAGMTGRAEGERVNMFLDFYFDMLHGRRKPKDDQAYDALMSLAAGSDKVKRNLRQQYTLLGQVFSHELRQQHPSISLEACEQASYVFVSLMYGHWKMVASLGLSEEHKHITRQAMNRLIESYLADPQPADCSRTWKPSPSENSKFSKRKN